MHTRGSHFASTTCFEKWMLEWFNVKRNTHTYKYYLLLKLDARWNDLRLPVAREIHTRTHARKHARTHAHMHARTHARTHEHIHTYKYTHTHKYTHIHMTHAHARTSMHTCTQARTHGHTMHTYIHTHVWKTIAAGSGQNGCSECAKGVHVDSECAKQG